MNNDKSPVTPKKRYSCNSEYATPKDSDDSDSSLYYSFVLSEDDNAMYKENSVNGSFNSSVAQLKAKTPLLKAKTPLLKKVLQTMHTPRNINNKRVSFSHLPKPSPATVKIVKTTDSDIEAPKIDTNFTFNLKLIEESLPIFSNEQPILKKIEEEHQHNYFHDSSIIEDLDNELQNTIIENTIKTPSSVSNSTLTSSSEAPALPVSNPQLINTGAKATITRTVEELLREAHKNESHTRNAAKMNRQRLAKDSRKSVLPTAKKLTRRSSTYEPRKIDPRKSLGVLKQVANKVTKTFQKNTSTVASSSSINKQSVASNSTQSSEGTAGKLQSKKSETVSRMPTLKQRPILAKQPPRMSIVTTATRQSIATNVRAQRRETKSSLQSLTLQVAKASTSFELPPSSSTKQATFIKPKGLPVRSTFSTNVMTTSNGISSGKCQYCDKYFAKSHGMMMHLLEKCEKIPASARRQLAPKIDETISKKHYYAFRQDNDCISKYSRFFENITTNEGASSTRDDGVATNDVENGLKNLRAELRKIKGAHTGITRTPSKPIRCHICNKLFFDCVEYADHSVFHHLHTD